MQLRSGNTTLTTRQQAQQAPTRILRRDSRNHEEFNERRRYQEEQKQIEASIYDDEDEDQEDRKTTKLKKKLNSILKRTRHLLYLNEQYKQNNRCFTEKVNNIKEIYELFLYNIDDLIEIFNGEMKHDLRFPEVIYRKGIQLRLDINKAKRTRNEQQIAYECNELINHVVQLIKRYILN